MPRRRTTRLLVALLAAVALVPADPGGAAEAVVKDIAFPVDGKVTYSDTHGAPRSGGRTHEGQDLMGAKMTRLVAAVSGVVHRLKFDNLSAGGNSVVIKADDGWTYHYIHVNNDTPGTDDGQALREHAFPPDIVEGARVTRGQLVGYLGDSGNAESTAPHLHFEIREPAPPGAYVGPAINAYPSLKAAEDGIITTSRWYLRRTADTGPAEEELTYGMQVGDRGLLCDWDGDEVDELVVYRQGVWHLKDGTLTGTTARQIVFGAPSDVPLCGDLDGDGQDQPVVFGSGGRWTVRSGFGADDPAAWTTRYGLQPGDRPVLGDWDGDGREDLAIFRAPEWHVRSTALPAGSTVARFRYGMQPGDLPVAGDWDGDGRDDAGIYRGREWHLRRSAAVGDTTASTVHFGPGGGQPVTGYGADPVRPGIGVFQART